MMANCAGCGNVWFTSDARGQCPKCGRAWPVEEPAAPAQTTAPVVQPLATVVPLPAMQMHPAPALVPATVASATTPPVSIPIVVLCSIVPGGGQLYLGRGKRGALILAGFVVSFATGMPFIVWIAAMVDACILAAKQNQSVQQFDR